MKIQSAPLRIFSLALLALTYLLNPNTAMAQQPKTYLALGDSYTIGEAVPEADRWPVQLVTRLRADGVVISDPKIIATTGWTTAELQQGIGQANVSGTYDMVSLLIGVNNQYRGYDMAIYKKEFSQLLEQAIAFAAGNPSNVFVVSIPDYGVTPFAADRNLDPKKIARELDAYNQMASEIAGRRGIRYFEITEWSRRAATDSSLVASDGLHPSGKMYTNWVDTCYDWVFANLSTR